MSDPNSYIAEMLRISSRGYAARAAEQLLERHPECGAPFGSSAFRNWQDNLAQRINELAVSLELDEPSLFSAQLEWTRDAFAAREVPVEHLRHSLESLRATLREDLPDGAQEGPVRFIDEALEQLADGPPQRPRLMPETDASRLALHYIEAVMSGDRRRAVQLVTDAVGDGLSVDDAYERVLLPAQVEVGAMWHLGEISVPEEHAVTETTRTVMGILSQHVPATQESGPLVLVAAVEGDRHDIGVRAVADLLELNGFRVMLLGCDLPVEDVARAVTDFSADVVVLAASLSIHLRQVGRCIGAIRDADTGGGVGVIVGGPAFAGLPQLAERMEADGYAASPREAVELARRLAPGP